MNLTASSRSVATSTAQSGGTPIVQRVPLATETHPECCREPNCQLAYVDHLRGFGVSAEATPNRTPHAARSVAKDRVWDKDLDAYKRLRQSGVQPSSNLGSARLEATADHRWQIESKPRQAGES